MTSLLMSVEDFGVFKVVGERTLQDTFEYMYLSKEFNVLYFQPIIQAIKIPKLYTVNTLSDKHYVTTIIRTCVWTTAGLGYVGKIRKPTMCNKLLLIDKIEVM